MSTIEEIEARAISILGYSGSLLEKALDVIASQKVMIEELQSSLDRKRLHCERLEMDMEDLNKGWSARERELLSEANIIQIIRRGGLMDTERALSVLKNIDVALVEIRGVKYGSPPPEGARECEKKLLAERFAIAGEINNTRKPEHGSNQ